MLNIDLKGKVAVVTGGNSGLGEASVKALSSCDAKIAICHLPSQAESAMQVLDQLGRPEDEAICLPVDISSYSSVLAMFEAIDKTFSRVDILVNNAGIDGDRDELVDADITQWEEIIKVNLFGATYCAKQALMRMKIQNSGVIVNMTSVHEYIAWSGYSAYAVSKAALSMLTKTLAQEAGGYNVRVLSVAPGAIETQINKNVWSNPTSLSDLDKKILLGRPGDAEEIGNVVAFLASPFASYITGTTIVVDGGMLDYPSFKHGG